jgi:hypothetical protein
VVEGVRKKIFVVSKQGVLSALQYLQLLQCYPHHDYVIRISKWNPNSGFLNPLF